MKNVVTFETARALKEAGFPQPEPEYLQVWYEEFNPFVEGWSREDSRHIIGIGRFEIWHEDFDMSEYYFAPTATEILRELHNHFTTKQGYSVEIRASPTDDGFQVDIFEDLPFDAMKPIREINENLDEACAAAYLEIKGTP